MSRLLIPTEAVTELLGAFCRRQRLTPLSAAVSVWARRWRLLTRESSYTPGYRDQRMLRRNLLLKEHLNMILMPNATTMVIITAKGMSAVIIMVKDMTAVIITEKTMSAVIITGKALTAAMKRETRAAAAITTSKPM